MVADVGLDEFEVRQADPGLDQRQVAKLPGWPSKADDLIPGAREHYRVAALEAAEVGDPGGRREELLHRPQVGRPRSASSPIPRPPRAGCPLAWRDPRSCGALKFGGPVGHRVAHSTRGTLPSLHSELWLRRISCLSQTTSSIIPKRTPARDHCAGTATSSFGSS